MRKRPLVSASVTPATFDTGSGLVTLQFCATATDDLSGVHQIGLFVSCDPCSASCSNTVSDLNFSTGTLTASHCGNFTMPQFSPYGTYYLWVSVTDYVGHETDYANPAYGFGANLCD